MKKIIFALVFAFVALGMFAQNKTDKAITKLMYVKQGMKTVDAIAGELTNGVASENLAKYTAEMKTFKTDMLQKARESFKANYTLSQLDAIYTECTSDKVDYTDLTNNFFAKWREYRGEYFRNAKQTYFKYKK